MHSRWKPRTRPAPPATPGETGGALALDLDRAAVAVLGWLGVLGVYQHRLYVGRAGALAEVAVDVYASSPVGRSLIAQLGVERHGTRSIEEAARKLAELVLEARQRVRVLFRGFVFDVYPAPPPWATRIAPAPFPNTSLAVESVIDIERRGQV